MGKLYQANDVGSVVLGRPSDGAGGGGPKSFRRIVLRCCGGGGRQQKHTFKSTTIEEEPNKIDLTTLRSKLRKQSSTEVVSGSDKLLDLLRLFENDGSEAEAEDDSTDLTSLIPPLYALLNLSIGNDANKAAIVQAGAVHKMLKIMDSAHGSPMWLLLKL